MSNDSKEILDVAIIGGGVSGVYSGWRLMRDSGPATFGNSGSRPRITVFEGSDRIGGRLLSVKPPGMPDTTCELGGMRFMSRHVIVSALVQYFNLETAGFPVYEPQNIAYFRGRQLRLADLTNPSAIPYNVTDVERSALSNPATGLLMYALQQIIPNCLDVTYDELCVEVTTATFDGRPLKDHGFWNVLSRILSPDAYAFVRDSCGYDLLVSNSNAADSILFILSDFGPGVVYSRCVDGYDQIPQRLAAEFQAAGGTVQLGTWLKSFDSATLPDGTNGVALTFRDGSAAFARHLVLALPQRSLELLDHTGSVLDASHTDVWRLIDAVYPIPMFKIFLAYAYPWWAPAGVSQGRTLTDLPIRQCYYWDVVQSSPTTQGNAVLLASYDDENSVSFWAGLRKKSAITEYYQPSAQVADEPATAGTWSGHRAPKAMVEEAHRQIVQMHGLSYAPKPYAAAYRDWSEDPFGGGINVWKIYSDSSAVINSIINPRPGTPVYICGEAYSHEQGWVEGALMTTELMLTKCFGLPSHVPAPAATAPAGAMSVSASHAGTHAR
ncbi:MAG TPA: NAD(P)/FAD-dependent oxidoreductase [Gemmatimonadaceae bacterium]|jgi:monoamine oxidase|nr:NAD(P)/FAD-dependent oxidoreductase [Gemmatimonadaceae bacterium]